MDNKYEKNKELAEHWAAYSKKHKVVILTATQCNRGPAGEERVFINQPKREGPDVILIDYVSKF